MSAVEQQGKDSSSMVVTSPQLDYTQKTFHHGQYSWLQVYANTYQAPIALNTSQTPVVLNLPNDVYNLSQSYLNFQVMLPKSTGNYIWTYQDVWSVLSHIQFYGAQGVFLVDLDNLQNYMKIVMKKEVGLNEFKTNDPMNLFYQSNTVKNAVPALRAGNSGTPNPSSLNYSEPAYFSVGTLSGDVVLNCILPLRFLKNTLFAMDKDLYFGTLMYMKLFFGPLSQVCYQSTSNASPNDGTPANYSADVQASPNVPTITNLSLYLAIEQDPSVHTQVISRFMSGESLYIPFVQAFKTTNSASLNQNMNILLQMGSGITLLKMIHSLFDGSENYNLKYDCSNNHSTNFNGAASGGTFSTPGQGSSYKVNNYWTLINGRRLQTVNLDCTGGTQTISGGVPAIYTDYLLHYPSIKGSVLQNRDVYQQNWFHCDDFTGFGDGDQKNINMELLGGIPLKAIPLTWTFTSTVQNAVPYTHYTWAVVSRKVNVTVAGVLVE